MVVAVVPEGEDRVDEGPIVRRQVHDYNFFNRVNALTVMIDTSVCVVTCDISEHQHGSVGFLFLPTWEDLN